MGGEGGECGGVNKWKEDKICGLEGMDDDYLFGFMDNSELCIWLETHTSN